MTDWTFCPHCATRLEPGDARCRQCGVSLGPAPDLPTGDAATRDAKLAAIADELREALAPRLQLLHPLGHGGMGTVFLARDPALKRMVVVKVLSPELAHDHAAQKRFEREAEAAASVAHPNVVSIHQVGELPKSGTSYFVMQHVQGRTLADAFPEGTVVPEHRAKRIVGEVALALAAAHARGVVHRDIKPSNIMLEEGTDRAIVLDFGISAAVGPARQSQDTKLTAQGTSIGTPQYMSPEQAAGDETTERSDIYSLGLVAFELVTGRPAFKADSAMALIAAHIKDVPPNVRELRPDLDPHVAELVNRCLAKAPEDRPTAVDLGRALAPGTTSVVEWPPPGLELLLGRAYRYLVGVTMFVVFEALYGAITSIAMDEGSPTAAGAIGLLGGFLMIVYAITIARRGRHVPRGVRDARRVGYPRSVVWDVAIDRRPDTAQLVNRVGPFTSLAEGDARRFLRRRRIGVVTASALLIVALLSPVLVYADTGSEYLVAQVGALAAAWVALWWFERPERRYRKRYVRYETGGKRVAVSREVTESWLEAAGMAIGEGRPRALLDRLYANAFDLTITIVVVLGFLWLVNMIGVVAQFQSDPPGTAQTHVTALEDARDAARRGFPALALDGIAWQPVPGDVMRWSVLLRDSTHTRVRDLQARADSLLRRTGGVVGPDFEGIPDSMVRPLRDVLGPLDTLESLDAWRSLADPALPLLWYRGAFEQLRAEGPGDSVSVAVNASRSVPLRDLWHQAVLQLYRSRLAVASGEREVARVWLAEVVWVARNLTRDPFTADAGLRMLQDALPVLGRMSRGPGAVVSTADVAALEAYVGDFAQAWRAFGGRPGVKAMAEADEDDAQWVGHRLQLVADTTLQPVHRRALGRAAVLGACFQGYEFFYGTGGERDQLVEDVLERLTDLPAAEDAAELYRGLHWKEFRGFENPSLNWVGTVFWVVPRVLHCHDVLPRQEEADRVQMEI